MEKHTRNVEYLEQTLEFTLDIVSDGVWDWNANTGYVYRSPGWYRMLGYEVDSLANTVFTWENVIHPDDYDQVMAHFNDYINRKSNRYHIEYRCLTLGGGYLWVEDRGRVVKWNRDGTVARMIGAHRDIHQQKVAQLELERKNLLLEKLVQERTYELQLANQSLAQKLHEAESMAEMDPLTGVYNRHRLDSSLRAEMERASRHGTGLCLIIFDVDHFKRINDLYGHSVGDAVLISMIMMVQGRIRENDLLARWGGEEFAIVAPAISMDEAWRMAEKLRLLISYTQPLEGIRISCSFGIAEYQPGDDLSSLFRRADQAMYRAKSMGRNRVETSADGVG